MTRSTTMTTVTKRIAAVAVAVLGLVPGAALAGPVVDTLILGVGY